MFKFLKSENESNIDDSYNIRDISSKNAGVAIPQDVYELYKEIVIHTNVEMRSNIGCEMILLQRTSNASELASLYTMADIYANPTHGDNFPTTNLEAKACGTYIITYDVGGAKETLECELNDFV